jgi:L-threonylcarbamoyladenylate synthase
MQTLDEEVKKTCEVLNRGGVVLYPTDTVWGIGCDATNGAAVARVYAIKRRTDSRAMIVLLDTAAKLNSYVPDFPEIALDLIECSEKPLTIVYPGARNLAPGLLAADGSIGIRITGDAFSRQLCRAFKKPVVATSANISGEACPRNFREISREILQAVDYVADCRRDDTTLARPSSIIRLDRDARVEILRQ